MYILHQSAIKTPHFKWRPSFSILSNRRSEYPCHIPLNPGTDPTEIEAVAKIHVLFRPNLLRVLPDNAAEVLFCSIQFFDF